MISGLRGRILRFGVSRVHLETSGGVVYEVHVPLNVFDFLQRSEGEEIFLHICHQFLQDEERLYGFLESGPRDFFLALLSVKGLGSGLALSILSHLDGRTLLELCERNDIVSLTRIPRVGKTTAESLAFEINRKKDRFWKLLQDLEHTRETVAGREEDEWDLAFQALLQLGYRENQAKSALEKLSVEEGFSRDETASSLIRNALRFL